MSVMESLRRKESKRGPSVEGLMFQGKSLQFSCAEGSSFMTHFHHVRSFHGSHLHLEEIE